MSNLMKRIRAAEATLPGDRELLDSILHEMDQNVEFYRILDRNYTWYAAIARCVRPNAIVEIGTRFGYSGHLLLSAKEENTVFWSVDGEIDGIDCNKYARAVLEPDCVLHQLAIDTKWINSLPISKVDLAHIDAWHTEEGVYHECKLVLPHLRPGAVVLCDDTKMEDVSRGVDRFCFEAGATRHDIDTLNGLSVLLGAK